MDVVAVAVAMPRCLGPGEEEATCEHQIGGIPCAQAMAFWSGLVCSFAMIMWARQNPGAPDSGKLNMYSVRIHEIATKARADVLDNSSHSKPPRGSIEAHCLLTSS